MKVKYIQGDIFSIPLDNGKYAICQVIWAPQGDYKKVFSFVVLKNNNIKPILDFDDRDPKPLKDNGGFINVIFTSVKKISKGEWPILSHDYLAEKSRELLIFHIAGDLHNGDDFIRKLLVSEYNTYQSMSIFGFDLIQDVLINS